MSLSDSLLPGSAIASVVGAAGSWLLALVLGHAVLPTAKEMSSGDAIARLLTAAVAGTSLQSLIVLALSHWGALWSTQLVACTLALAVLAAALRGKRLMVELRLASSGKPASRDASLLLLLVALPLLAAFVLASVPTVYYDDLVYHLGLPRQALLAGAWPAQPGFHYSFLPSGWDAGHALPLAIGGGLGPQLRNAIALALLAIAALRLASRGGGLVAASAATALLLSAPMMPRLGALASNDLFVALAAAVALERALAGRAVEAALAAGAAWSAKYTGLPVVGATALVLALVRGGEPVVSRWARASAALGLALLLPIGWTLRTFVLTGNPVFPAFWSLLGGRHWSAISASALEGDVAGGTISERGPAALALAPFDWLLRSDQLSYPGSLQPLYLLAAALGLFLARRVRSGLPLLAAIGVLHLGVCLTSLYPRFALPLFVASLPFAAASIDELIHRLRSRPRALRLLAVLLLASACLWGTGKGLLSHVAAYGGGLELLLEPRDEILPERILLAKAERDLAAHLPEAARLLVVGEGRLALIPRRATCSSGYDPSWPSIALRASEDGRDGSERFAEFTHVLVNFKELERFEAAYAYRSHFADGDREAFLAWLSSLEPIARWGPLVLSENRRVPGK